LSHCSAVLEFLVCEEIAKPVSATGASLRSCTNGYALSTAAQDLVALGLEIPGDVDLAGLDYAGPFDVLPLTAAGIPSVAGDGPPRDAPAARPGRRRWRRFGNRSGGVARLPVGTYRATDTVGPGVLHPAGRPPRSRLPGRRLRHRRERRYRFRR
jgi:hypothetical protein